MEVEKKRSNYDLQVDRAKKIFMEYDQDLLIRKFQLPVDEQWIFMEYLNTPYRINRRDGRIEENLKGCGFSECRSYDTVMTIYDLLCYSKGEDVPVLFQKWHTINKSLCKGISKAQKRVKNSLRKPGRCGTDTYGKSGSYLSDSGDFLFPCNTSVLGRG